MKYCSEAERSTHDVFTKLVSWAITPEEGEIIIQKLKKENFLNDERYANSYVREKWNLDHWGKVKIEHALKQKNIEDGFIQKSLSTIDNDDYQNQLYKVLQKKWNEVKSEKTDDSLRSLMMFGLNRGFEEELILEWIEKQNIGSS
ncbi:MAG: regulatory protein RecX [Saprospiraceae bacterium]